MELNHAKLVELGIVKAQTELRICCKQQKVRTRPPKSWGAIREVGAEEPRRSERLTGSKPNYVTPGFVVEDLPKVKPLPRTPGQSRRDYWAVGWVNTVWPATESVRATLARAEEAAAQSSGPTGVKVMLPSHVAGGFWLQLPSEFTRCLPQAMGKHALVLQDTEGADSPVVWLRRGVSGGGLSGGWRGFAIAHRLAVGDVVLFEKTDDRTIRASIFRAVSDADRQALAASRAAPECTATNIDTVAGGDRSGSAEDLEVALTLEPDKCIKSVELSGDPKEDEEEEEVEYVVEKILSHRVNEAGGVEYQTAWLGYDDVTWEPRGSFVMGRTVTGLLLEYERAHGLRPAKRRRG
eukprot:EG_transcript_12379